MHSSCFGLSDDDNSSVQMDEQEDAEPIAPSKVQPRTSNDTRLLRMLEVASIPESLHVENRYVICTDNGEQSSKIYKGTSIDRSSSIFGHNKARKAFDGNEELCSQTWTERPSTRTIQVLSKSMWTMLECSDVRRKSFPLYAASFFKTDITISNTFIQTTNRQHAMAKISVSLFGTFGQLLPIQHGTNNLFYNHYFYLI
ncbi:hypothetical protein VTP01DRAFT_9109 [Rhizomucor pusillus]|uniref:uncharacterized protein n=1 Tax=Rhizomucor pusillus TaxID=4840 RepID=UPI003743895C